MPFADWIALKHPALLHLPIAVALLLPFAILAAQRVGRGIRPWWTTARFLAWTGFLGLLPAVLGDFLSLRRSGALPPGTLLAPRATALHWHQLCLFAGVILGILCLLTLYRRRRDHQGIGILALFTGLLWSASILTAQHFSEEPDRTLPLRTFQLAPAVAALPSPTADSSDRLPVRALDFQSLEPMHSEPVKSPPHGNRWIRAWASPDAAQAYQAGRPLPAGSFVVLSTLEDRWGRPGFEPGPLYSLEIKADGKPSLSFYWPRVPEAQRGETGGAAHVYWRGSDPGLQSCMACHGNGMAPLSQRSQWKVPRKPRTEDAPAQALPSAPVE